MLRAQLIKKCLKKREGKSLVNFTVLQIGKVIFFNIFLRSLALKKLRDMQSPISRKESPEGKMEIRDQKKIH